MKNLLILILALFFFSCGKDDLGYKASPFSFTLERNGSTELIENITARSQSSQGLSRQSGYYTARAVTGGRNGISSGIAINLPFQFDDSDMTTDDFKSIFELNKSYDLTSWSDGPSMYFGIVENDEVVRYTVKEFDPQSSFYSYFQIVSDLNKDDKTEDNEDYYTVTAEFEAELVNMEDSLDIIKITDGKVELTIVDFQSN